MERRNISGLCLLTCILLFGNAGRAVGQKPIPKDKKTPSEATFADETLKLWQRDIDAYRKHTKDPEAIRPLAEEFLRAVQQNRLPTPHEPPPDKTLEMWNKLKAQGCTDPLVFAYYATIVSPELKFYREAWKLLNKAAGGISKSDYPFECRWKLTTTLYSLGWSSGYPMNRGGWPRVREAAVTMAAMRVGDPTIGLEGQRVVVWELRDFFPGHPTGRKDSETLYKTCAKMPKADPWTINMLAGFYYHVLAWDHRGGGYASDVTPEGSRLFRENLKKAAEHFEKAYKLHPEFPEAAGEMISAAMEGGSDLTPREWFDRSVAAQFDYIKAYYKMANSLTPRQGGNHEGMYRFGCECADTERYDTNVPMFFLTILYSIDTGLDFNGEVWKRPGVYARAKRVLEGMARDPTRADGKGLQLNKSRAMSIHAAVAGLTGEYADARRLLDELDNRIAKDFTTWSRYPAVMFGTIYALTGKGADDAKKALKLLDQRPAPLSDATLRDARSLFKKALDADEHNWSKIYCQSWLDDIDAYLAFNAGQWADIKFDPKLVGWRPANGMWKMKNENSAEGIVEKHYDHILIRPAVVPPVPMEIEFNLGFSALPRASSRKILGLFVRQRNQKSIVHGFYLDTKSSEACVSILGKVKKKKMGLYRTNRFRVQLADGRAVLYVNDELCVDHSDNNLHPSSDLYFGCNSLMTSDISVTLGNVRIRKWDPTKEPPKEKETP